MVGKAALIQSVGSLRCWRPLKKDGGEAGHLCRTFCWEVNIGGEEAKKRLCPGGGLRRGRAALDMEHVRVHGLMTIPLRIADREENIHYFQEVRGLFVDINENLFHNELKNVSPWV